MTNEELERLAALIAAEIERQPGNAGGRRPSWLPSPVRPEPPTRGSAPAPWSGAGQRLGDLAPVRNPSPSTHRQDLGESTAAVRAAAAGRGKPRETKAARTESSPPPLPAPVSHLPVSTRRQRSLPIDVPIAISNRHLHLSSADARALFGSDSLTIERPLKQPGQFAAVQTVAAVGPRGRIEAVRVVGPLREATQLELAKSDASRLGVDPPVAASGHLEKSSGGITLVGPYGRIELAHGVIVAARHLHLSPEDGEHWGLRDGDLLEVRCGDGARAVTLHSVLVRCGQASATELHLDSDEARAAGVRPGELAQVVAWHAPTAARRPLVTERDVIEIVRLGSRIPDGAILTPGARDRARALGLTLG